MSMITRLQYNKSVYFSDIAVENIYQSFTQVASKLRHCHPRLR